MTILNPIAIAFYLSLLRCGQYGHIMVNVRLILFAIMVVVMVPTFWGAVGPTAVTTGLRQGAGYVFAVLGRRWRICAIDRRASPGCVVHEFLRLARCVCVAPRVGVVPTSSSGVRDA